VGLARISSIDVDARNDTGADNSVGDDTNGVVDVLLPALLLVLVLLVMVDDGANIDGDVD